MPVAKTVASLPSRSRAEPPILQSLRRPLVHRLLASASEPEVHGAGMIDGLANGLLGGDRVHRGQQGQVRHGAQDPYVLRGVVAGAVEAHGDPRVGAEHPHREVRVADVRPDVLRGDHAEEERVAGDVGLHARRGQTGRRRDHVALGYAEVEVPLRELLTEVVHLRRAPEVGGEHADVVPVSRHLREHPAGDELLAQLQAADHVPALLVEARNHGGAVGPLPRRDLLSPEASRSSVLPTPFVQLGEGAVPVPRSQKTEVPLPGPLHERDALARDGIREHHHRTLPRPVQGRVEGVDNEGQVVPVGEVQ